MERETSVRLELVTKTTEEWAEVNSHIIKGVPCVENAADGKTYLKIGDGTSTFDQLPYVSVPGSSEITVDGELSEDSENPVQNKVLTAEIGKCLKTDDSLTLKCTL